MQVVGYDEDKDVAVLRVESDAKGEDGKPLPPPPLKPVSLGDSSKVLVGQAVYAIGNPFGMDHTLTHVSCYVPVTPGIAAYHDPPHTCGAAVQPQLTINE